MFVFCFFFSLLKHIAVYLFLICYAYKSLKLFVKSGVVPKLPGYVRPELPEGPSLMHSLSLATPSIIFSSVYASILAVSSIPQDIKLLLFFFYSKTNSPCQRNSTLDETMLAVISLLFMF